jgi:hypothetical protein
VNGSVIMHTSENHARGAYCSSPKHRFLASHGAFCLKDDLIQPCRNSPDGSEFDLRHQFIWRMSV